MQRVENDFSHNNCCKTIYTNFAKEFVNIVILNLKIKKLKTN